MGVQEVQLKPHSKLMIFMTFGYMPVYTVIHLAIIYLHYTFYAHSTHLAKVYLH